MPYYIGIVSHDPGSAWGISFPDLPGCFSAAGEFHDLPAKAEEAVALHFEGLAEDEVEIPQPSSMEQVQAHEDAVGAVSFLPVKAPELNVVRLNITLPGTLVQRIDARVGPRERSAFLAKAARIALAVEHDEPEESLITRIQNIGSLNDDRSMRKMRLEEKIVETFTRIILDNKLVNSHVKGVVFPYKHFVVDYTHDAPLHFESHVSVLSQWPMRSFK